MRRRSNSEIAVGSNATYQVNGSNDQISVGATSTLTATGSALAVTATGAGDVITLGGNGEGASNANDDTVVFTTQGQVSLLDNSRADVTGRLRDRDARQ